MINKETKVSHKNDHLINLSRRDFIKLSGAGLGLAVGAKLLETPVEAAQPVLAIAEKGSPANLLKAALGALGGIKTFVKPGQRVVIKPNVAWARTPEQACTNNPDIMEALIKECYAAGAKQVVLWEHTCDNYQFAFARSGLNDVAKKANAPLYSGHGKNVYTQVTVPRGKRLKEVMIIEDILNAEVLINLPIAKQHYATELTLGLKNMMGTVWDMEWFHKNDLHQCIADLNTVVRPQLTIVDAYKILINKGPKGPGDLEAPGLVMASADPVAVDAYAAGLFKNPKTKKPFLPREIPFIVKSHQQGLGEIDLKKVNVKKVVAG